jgi:hypothetical protein
VSINELIFLFSLGFFLIYPVFSGGQIRSKKRTRNTQSSSTSSNSSSSSKKAKKTIVRKRIVVYYGNGEGDGDWYAGTLPTHFLDASEVEVDEQGEQDDPVYSVVFDYTGSEEVNLDEQPWMMEEDAIGYLFKEGITDFASQIKIVGSYYFLNTNRNNMYSLVEELGTPAQTGRHIP